MQKSKEHFDEKAIHKVLKGFADGIRAVLEGINTYVTLSFLCFK